MKYAIIEIGGHQVWIEEGQYILTNRIIEENNKKLIFNRILFLKNNNKFILGYPYIKNIKIYSQIITHLNGAKINVYKMKSKKKYRRKLGYRQSFTKLLITNIIF